MHILCVIVGLKITIINLRAEESSIMEYPTSIIKIERTILD
jgi:hypothetical protein